MSKIDGFYFDEYAEVPKDAILKVIGIDDWSNYTNVDSRECILENDKKFHEPFIRQELPPEIQQKMDDLLSLWKDGQNEQQ